jgi:hypothetical protein
MKVCTAWKEYSVHAEWLSDWDFDHKYKYLCETENYSFFQMLS